MPEALTCYKCSQESTVGAMDDKASARRWRLLEVLDFKEKKFGVLGFPTGSTYTIEGWKVRQRDSFLTYICGNCVGRQALEFRRSSKRFFAIGLVMLVVAAGVPGVFYLVFGTLEWYVGVPSLVLSLVPVRAT